MEDLLYEAESERRFVGLKLFEGPGVKGGGTLAACGRRLTQDRSRSYATQGAVSSTIAWTAPTARVPSLRYTEDQAMRQRPFGKLN